MHDDQGDLLRRISHIAEVTHKDENGRRRVATQVAYTDRESSPKFQENRDTLTVCFAQTLHPRPHDFVYSRRMTGPTWRRLRLLRRSALLAIGCGTVSLTHPAHRYTITTGFLSVEGGPVMACYLMTLSLPPTGCGGVVVHGVHIRRLPGAHAVSNGTVQTSTMRLVGTWDGQALTLTEPPVPAEPTPLRLRRLKGAGAYHAGPLERLGPGRGRIGANGTDRILTKGSLAHESAPIRRHTSAGSSTFRCCSNHSRTARMCLTRCQGLP